MISSSLLLMSVVGAAAVEAPAPSLFREYSSRFIEEAIAARKTGVSPAQASSAASVILNKGMQPKQYTEIAEIGEKLMSNTRSLNPTSLSHMANLLNGAYSSIHTQASYSSYVEYVKQHVSLYDVEKIRKMEANAVGTNTARLQAQRRELVEMYASLMGNPEGRHAIETFSRVMNDYMKDFGVRETNGQGTRLVEFIYNLI